LSGHNQVLIGITFFFVLFLVAFSIPPVLAVAIFTAGIQPAVSLRFAFTEYQSAAGVLPEEYSRKDPAPAP
jgi:hypothetical protein